MSDRDASTDASVPPYRLAAVAGGLVLLGYIITLAPTVTFWDAGEFITAAKTLGIPHPPGTPLFVLLTSVWGRIVPLGSYAWRINLLSAVCGALAAACWCLVAHDIVRRLHTDIDARSRAALAALGGLAAAGLTSFAFTNWQNSTETEVYSASMLVVALIAWIATRWRAVRNDSRGDRLLLAATYLCALSVGTHLMGLLAGPALIAGLAMTTYHRREPPGEMTRERAMIGLVGAAWVTCVGVGLGSAPVLAIGTLALIAAVWAAARAGAARFATIAVIVLVAGISTLLFLLLRARQHPWLDQAIPSTWQGLVNVVRRAQYAPRGPFDDPTVLHGAGNPGRTFTLLAYQIANYVQYLDWQWSAAIGELDRASIPRLVITLAMAAIGVRGAFAQRRNDRPSFALAATLFLVAGPVLLLYLNFKPGPSIGWDRWTTLADHEVRDRDYFFAASFAVWGFWISVGLADIVRSIVPRVRRFKRAAAFGVFSVALVPVVFNYRVAARQQTPDATFAREFAYALLQSAPPNAVLFTWGDNDTFPLWYAQQVEGFRQDVTVVCLALAQTQWYVRLLAHQPHVEAVREQLAPAWHDTPIVPIRGPLLDLDDAAIDSIRPTRSAAGVVLDLGRYGVARIAAGSVVYPMDATVLAILRTNAGRRPIAWSITASDELLGLGPQLVQQGMALVMPLAPVDPARLARGDAAGPGSAPLDLVTTGRLIDESWTFGRLEREGSSQLEGNIAAVATTIATPMTQTAAALIARGDTLNGIRMLRRAIRISDDSIPRAMLARVSSRTR